MKKIFAEKVRVVVSFLLRAGLALHRWARANGGAFARQAVIWPLGILIRALRWIYRKDPVLIKAYIKGLGLVAAALVIFPGLPLWLLGGSWSLHAIVLIVGIFTLSILPISPLFALPFLPEEDIVSQNNHVTT